MKKLLLFSTVISIMILVGFANSNAYAVTASPYPFEFKQPDGSTVKIRMMGDEWVRWAETMDHFTLLRNAGGAWEYATTDHKGDIVPSGYLASNTDDRSADEQAFLSRTNKSLSFSKDQISFMRSIRAQHNERGITGFPTTGTINVLVILMEFQDVSFTKTQVDFHNLMNQVNYNGTGSFGEFYYENSYGNLTINTTVAGVYTADDNMAYYGTNIPSDDYRVDELITEAVILADGDVNYADFDNDNDGDVDAVYVIYAGYGEEAGGGADAIWAHASGIDWIQHDGVWISKYACSAELRGDSGTDITGIGVICHEFGHSLGAPDYYDVDYANNGEFDGTGEWDMMASGSWNNNGDIPAHHNPFTKYYYYNWLTPSTINAAQEVTLRDIAAYPDVVRVNTTTSNEYFLFENRQQTGFNAACPGHGMIIYHVDGDYINAQYPSNTINNDAHQGMYPMSAISTTSNGIMFSSVSTINTSGCPWPGTGNKTIFDDATTPNSKSWAANNTSKPVLGIREVNGEIKFCLIECSFPGNFTADPVSLSQVDLSWTLNSSSDPVLVAVNSSSTFGSPENGTEYSTGNVIPGGGTVIYSGLSTTYIHTGLDANTTYFYQVWSVQSGVAYTSANAANATTFCTLITSFPWNEGFENGGSIPSCWTQENVAGSLDWEFRAGSSNGNPAEAHSGSYNANLATLSYSSPITKLITPAINLTAISSPTLKFWHTQKFWSPDQDELRVYYRTSASDTWNLLEEYTSDVAIWTERTISLPSASATYYIAFEGTANAGYGVCIDDVEISGTSLPFWTGTVSNDWNTSGNWLNNTVPTGSSDVIISDVSTKPVVNQTIGSPAVCNNLTIQAGGSLTINAGKALTVNGTLTNSAGNAGLVVKSDATGTGSLIHSNSGVSATVERYVAAADWITWDDGWHLLSSPIANHTIAGSFTVVPENEYDFYAWSEPDNIWVNFKETGSPNFVGVNGSNTFKSGAGYLVAYKDADTKLFTGNLNVSDVNPGTLTLSSGVNQGWNLLGNPFASALTWYTGWTVNNIGGVANIWNEVGKSYTPRSAGDPIPQANGFMVQVLSGTGSLTIPASARVHNAQGWYKNTNYPVVSLFAHNTDNPSFQESQVRFNPEATENFDAEFDGNYLAGYAPQFYSTFSGHNLMVNSLPFTDELSIPFTFIGNEGAHFRIEAAVSGDLSSNIYLLDKQTGTDHNLSQNPVYSFIASANDNPERFMLHFKTVGINEPANSDQIEVVYVDGTINITNMGQGKIKSVSVADMAGHSIYNGDLQWGVTAKISLSASLGVYLVFVETETHFFVKKLLIH